MSEIKIIQRKILILEVEYEEEILADIHFKDFLGEPDIFKICKHGEEEEIPWYLIITGEQYIIEDCKKHCEGNDEYHNRKTSSN